MPAVPGQPGRQFPYNITCNMEWERTKPASSIHIPKGCGTLLFASTQLAVQCIQGRVRQPQAMEHDPGCPMGFTMLHLTATAPSIQAISGQNIVMMLFSRLALISPFLKYGTNRT